jgi:putative (di)nucleoside polyphosphate hydrolase
VPLDVVIEFKRDVYQRALQELSRFVTWPPGGQERRQSSRYLRQPHERRGQAGQGNRQSGPNTRVADVADVASKAISDAAGSSMLVLAARDKE